MIVSEKCDLFVAERLKEYLGAECLLFTREKKLYRLNGDGLEEIQIDTLDTIEEVLILRI